MSSAAKESTCQPPSQGVGNIVASYREKSLPRVTRTSRRRKKVACCRCRRRRRKARPSRHRSKTETSWLLTGRKASLAVGFKKLGFKMQIGRALKGVGDLCLADFLPHDNAIYHDLLGYPNLLGDPGLSPPR